MLTAEGCRQRRQRLLQKLDLKAHSLDHLLLADPMHLMYLANSWVDPFSLGAGFSGFLLVRPDGHATLIHDNRLPKSADQTHVDIRQVVPWYDGQSPGNGPRQLAACGAIAKNGDEFRIHDRPGDRMAQLVVQILAKQRRQKGADE